MESFKPKDSSNIWHREAPLFLYVSVSHNSEFISQF